MLAFDSSLNGSLQPSEATYSVPRQDQVDEKQGDECLASWDTGVALCSKQGRLGTRLVASKPERLGFG